MGLIITLILKYQNYSINPFWGSTDGASGGWNKIGLFLAMITTIEYSYRPVELFPRPPLSDEDAKDHPAIAPPGRLHHIAMSLSLGALIHLIQTFVTDAGTIIAWTWTGFPITGPTLHPFAGVVIAAAAAGLIHDPDSPWFDVLGCVGSHVL